MNIPEDLLKNILIDIALPLTRGEDHDPILVYKSLLDIIDIFNTCPSTMHGNRNQSKAFVQSLDNHYLAKDGAEFKRIDRLLQHVHYRIIEKFKDFRVAFRRFDKNFDGSLNFRELITGFDEIGINLTLPDYRLIFDKIDFDKAKEVDFFKFCLLNYDKGGLREKLS